MSPGRRLDEELTRLHRAAGRLSTMITLKRISRDGLHEVANACDEVSRVVREILKEATP